MIPVDFNEANVIFNPPPDLQEGIQCMPVQAWQGNVKGGSIDGAFIVVTVWKATDEELEVIKQNGGLIYLSFIGGLPPHLAATNFHDATHPL